MKNTLTTLLTAVAGVWLFAAAAPAMAHDHGRDRHWDGRHDHRGWGHEHRRHHRHERD